MDSNCTRFLLLNSAADFGERSADCGWDAALGAFALARRDSPRLPAMPAGQARTALAACLPLVLDSQGQYGRLSPDRRQFEFALKWPAADADWKPVRAELACDSAPDLEALALDPVDAPAGTAFSDLHLGGEGLAALPWAGAARYGLTVVHLRKRWQALCELDFPPKRVWVDSENRIWLASDDAFALCRGGPLPQPYMPRPERFEPSQVNPDPLRPLWRQTLPENAGLVALTADADWLYLLVDLAPRPDGTIPQAILRRSLDEDADRPLETFPVDAALPYATDLATVEAESRSLGQILLLAPLDAAAQANSRRDCAVVALETGAAHPIASLQPERWPMHSLAAPRLVRALDGRIRYLADDRPRQLYPLAQARFAQHAEAVLSQRLDAGEPDTLWHRLTLEACIPPGCRLQVAVRVCDDWDRRAESGWDPQPEPLWLPQASELPFDAGRLAPIPVQQGLFEILLQRPNGRVRELRGRYLELRLTLSGDGRHSPAIHAIRVWFPRFSWQQAYLPGHFHQQERPPAQTPTKPEAANAADLRERLLAGLEGILTPIEERIAASECLLYPESMPIGTLPGLAASLGSRLPAHWPEARQREWLAHQGTLQRRRGSYAGLCLALDIATDGAVGRGQIVPVEDFRLRRTLATVLGIDMGDEGHPLTLGTGQSGNSLVGESLILSDENAREFLALFAPELMQKPAQSQRDRRAVTEFFDRYARRLTVVLHGEARALRRTVEAILPEQVPAVVQWAIRETDHPFVLGLSPLLQIDTYLERQPPFGRVVLNRTRLGRGDLLANPVALSPEHAPAARAF